MKLSTATKINANLRKAAKGQPCMVRWPGCNADPETTVLAHIRRAGNAGMGMKPVDITAVLACSNCHDAIDKRNNSCIEDAYIIDALCRTHDHWKRMGLLT